MNSPDCYFRLHCQKPAETYGKIRAQLEARGEMIGNKDLSIAALALASYLTLVTINEKQFRRASGLREQNGAV